MSHSPGLSNSGGEAGEGGGLTEKSLAIGESIHPNTLPKQEGLQLAEASFRDMEVG